MDTQQEQRGAMTIHPPLLYQLDLATLGYAIGRLLQRTSLRSARSLRNATVVFLVDVGISLEAMSEQDRAMLFSQVGRGSASSAPSPMSTRRQKEGDRHS